MKNTDSKKGRVILTYGRSLMALTAAHSLGKRGIEVIGCDDVDMTVLRFSNHVTDYFTHAEYNNNLELYLNDLEKNIKKFKPEDDRPYILMPMFRDATILAKHKKKFESLIDISVPDFEAINQITPKDIFANTCEKLDLKIPKTFQPKNDEGLLKIKDKIEFPILIKTTDGVGGRGITKAHNYAEMVSQFHDSIKEFGTPPLIQDVIEGQDYCLTAICDRGEIIASMAYKNLYQFPRHTGAGIMRETIDDRPFIKTSAKLLKALKWHGIAQIDFRWSGKDTDSAYLIESNPRFWAGLFHSVESGIDYPWLLYQLTAFGKITDIGEVEIARRTKVPGLWAIPALQEIVESGTHFEELKSAWHDIWHCNDNEDWRSRFSHFSEALKESLSMKDMKISYNNIQQMASSAVSEFSSEDDPKTGLGFLFVASSLLRHGKLPPELK